MNLKVPFFIAKQPMATFWQAWLCLQAAWNISGCQLNRPQVELVAGNRFPRQHWAVHRFFKRFRYQIVFRKHWPFRGIGFSDADGRPPSGYKCRTLRETTQAIQQFWLPRDFENFNSTLQPKIVCKNGDSRFATAWQPLGEGLYSVPVRKKISLTFDLAKIQLKNS